MPYVVLLAMIAGFLALRLYMVLGKRTGHEQALPKVAEERPAAAALPRPADMPTEAGDMVSRVMEERAHAGIRAIIAADSSFGVAAFVEGAKAAYRMTLEAFWKGDTETLALLVDDEVRAEFAQAIADRQAAGHVLDNRLIAIERATIVDASLNAKVARITLRFDADISAVTRNAEGQLVAGSLSDAEQTHDEWTFARAIKSNDPNWKLVETDEA
ncbi:MAG: Tim44/TimA family putative adaptor protein [Sphingomonas sp.]